MESDHTKIMRLETRAQKVCEVRKYSSFTETIPNIYLYPYLEL